MEYCGNCGGALSKYTEGFCPSCGARLPTGETPSVATSLRPAPRATDVQSFSEPRGAAPARMALGVQGGSHFDGSILGFLGMGIGTALFSIVTLGLGVPWAIVWWQRWETRHTIISGYRLRFTGTGLGLFWRWLKMVFFCVITAGIYTLWVWRYLKCWTVEHTELMAQ